jgi:hypothetical protein
MSPNRILRLRERRGGGDGNWLRMVTMTEFRRKYFDEAFPCWFTMGNSIDINTPICDPTEIQISSSQLILEHDRVLEALWFVVKEDYELFTQIRDRYREGS